MSQPETPATPMPSAPPPPPMPPAQPAPPAPRRRSRSARLMTWAAILGVSAGVCAGYIIQADRPPTPLPPLSQPGLVYPAKPATADEKPEPLAADRDHLVKTDGDLRKLLLKKPRGAREWHTPGSLDGWLSPAAFAEEFDSPGSVFERWAGGIRRTATTAWRDGNGVLVQIQLIQFRDDTSVHSAGYLNERQAWQSSDLGSAASEKPIPGSGNGELYVDPRPHHEPGLMPYYTAQAIARRGDVVMEVWLMDTHPVKGKQAMSLAERQWERL